MYEPHLPVEDGGRFCKRCESLLTCHADDMAYPCQSDADAIAYDAQMISLRMGEGHPVAASEVREVAAAVTRLAGYLATLEG